MKFFKNRMLTVMLVLILVVGISFTIYARSSSAADGEAAPVLQTAKVRTGDMLITANGAGTVLPAQQVELGFRTAGVVGEVNVSLGEGVRSGDVLASLVGVDAQLDFAQAEANLNWLFSRAGIAEYQIAVANAQSTYDATVVTLQYYISPDVYYWEMKLVEAQQLLAERKADSGTASSALADAEKSVEQAELNLISAHARFEREYVPEMFTYTWVDEVTGEDVTQPVPPSDADVTLARASVEQARLALADAQLALEIVMSGDRDVLAQSLSAADGTALAKVKATYLNYENSRIALENTLLVAPFDGSIVELGVIRGQTVGTSSVATLATSDNLMVRFYLDETDVDKAAKGMPVNLVFDAYPDTVIEGEILFVEPALQIVDGTPVVVAWATLPTPTPFTVLSGMSVEVEVIAAETKGALIVPVQALRELTPGSYAVFLVSPSGDLKMTPVTIGLRDYANVEILSGVKAGDVVSTGNIETE